MHVKKYQNVTAPHTIWYAHFKLEMRRKLMTMLTSFRPQDVCTTHAIYWECVTSTIIFVWWESSPPILNPWLNSIHRPLTINLKHTMHITCSTLIPVNVPKNLLKIIFINGRIFNACSFFVKRIPNSSKTLGNVESTSPTI